MGEIRPEASESWRKRSHARKTGRKYMKRKRKKREFIGRERDRPPQFKEGRRCSLCRKQLSVYNMGPTCLSYCGTGMVRYG